eukprot:13929064-Alexandrium_andersonii.AAC.1
MSHRTNVSCDRILQSSHLRRGRKDHEVRVHKSYGGPDLSKPAAPPSTGPPKFMRSDAPAGSPDLLVRVG